MYEREIKEICLLAHEIDLRINLFQGYNPKQMNLYKGELLFWRQVVSLYGLFADCDRAQIKEKKNIFDLMKRYDLIEREDYEFVVAFWNDISELRKWFCHNNDPSLFYAGNRAKKICNFLNSAFVLTSNKPKKIEEISNKDWNILSFNIDNRFKTYLDVLRKGLLAWKDSIYRDDLLDEWLLILSSALFSDKELIQNVLADIAVYERINQQITNMTVSQLASAYNKQLEHSNFSASNMEAELRNNASKRPNKDIIFASIKGILKV